MATDSKAPTTTDTAREDIEELLGLLKCPSATDAQRWTALGYIQGLDDAGHLSEEDYHTYRDRLGISDGDARDAGVYL